MSQKASCPVQVARNKLLLPNFTFSLAGAMSVPSPEGRGDVLGSLGNPKPKGTTRLSRGDQKLPLCFPLARLKCSGSLFQPKIEPLKKTTMEVNNLPCPILSPSSVPQLPPSTFDHGSGCAPSPVWRFVSQCCLQHLRFSSRKRWRWQRGVFGFPLRPMDCVQASALGWSSSLHQHCPSSLHPRGPQTSLCSSQKENNAEKICSCAAAAEG